MAYLTKEGLERLVAGIKALSLLKGGVDVVGYSFSSTAIGPGITVTLTKNVKRTGYTAIGIVGTDTRSSWVIAYKSVINNDIATLSIRNIGTSGFLELTPAVWVLYTKN